MSGKATTTSLSLRLKLSLFAAFLVLVPGLLFGFIVQQSGHASLQNLIGRQLAREAEHTRDQLIAIFKRERETLASFAQQDLMREIRVEDIDKRISAALATLRDGNPVRIDYLVLDRRERVIASSNPVWIGPRPAWLELSQDAWLRPSRFADPTAARALGAPGVLMETPVPDPDFPAEAIGILVGVYDWIELTKVIQDVRDDLTAQGIRADVLVAREDGSLIGGSGDDSLRAAIVTSGWAGVDRGAQDESEFHVLTESKFLVGRASLGSEFSNWQVLIADPFSDAFAPVRQLTDRLALILALTLLVALVVATLAGRHVVRPLSELTTAVRNLSLAGLSTIRVPVRNEDEVGTLANAFNRMAGELDKAQGALVEAAKFALVGELAAGVAHELRTSLGVLRSSVQIVERTMPEDGDSETIELMHLIRAEVDRLGGIVNELLELGRPRARKLERIPLAAPIIRALDLVQAQATTEDVELVRTALVEDHEVTCDVEMIHQVVLNLLVNAIQALESGGRVEVKMREPHDGYVGFEVLDDGPGIAPDMLEKVFRPFVSAREGGIGLGLTFVQRVVYEHHGRLGVESELGRGTRFWVEIPLAEDEA